MMHTIIGREAERARISELLDRARVDRSGSLAIVGDPGIGKSALLEEAHAQAPDMRVLSGSGTDSEAHLPFAALHQLVRPLIELAEDIPAQQAAALRGALGLAEGGGDDRFLVFLAVLSLLAEAAEQQPLLCLVDDAHCLDEASADALLFVARRIEAEGIVMLFAAREGESSQFEASGLPMLRITGLEARAAAALLERAVAHPPAPDVRDRLIEEAQGNPLALLELASSLSEGQLSGVEPVFAPIPVSKRIERVFTTRLLGLPKDAQTLLLVAAADDTGDLALVLRAAAELGAGPAALGAVEGAGLAHVQGTRLALRHPLVRSAVYQGAPLSERQAVHLALANALEGEAEADRRAWHRAAASITPDDSVVEELERAAERARRRSALAAASLALERAASLSADERRRVTRLTAAAECAWLAGRLQRVTALVERTRPLASNSIERADLDRLGGLIELYSGMPAIAYRLLFAAAVEVAPVDSERALQLLNLAGLASFYAGERDAATAIAEQARALELQPTPLSRMLQETLIGLGAHFQDDFARAAESLRLVLAIEEALPEATLTDQPVALLFAGRAALFLSDDDRGQRLHEEAAARARAAGALSSLTQILPRLAHLELRSGQLGLAAANAGEGLQLARELGQDDLVAYCIVVQALVAAYRGVEDECRSLAAEARALAAGRGFVYVVRLAGSALTLLELGLGRADAALDRARELEGDRSIALLAGLDRIEAAARAGERQLARAWLRVFESWAESGGAPWACGVALHGHALVAEDGLDAERFFERALSVHAESPRPFERARAELGYGEFLRRNRRRVDARAHLHRALDVFESLGASIWAERARVELRASGQTARRRDASTRGGLTSQELQIARFVSQGLSNREVAAQLFLSPRTVDFHLRNVFRKLGLSARSQLSRLDLDSLNPANGNPAISPARE
jgi:DNA-binding CsgD family transcriptional regulator